MVFRESRVVDEVWAGVAPRALAGEALLIVLGALRRVTGRARRDFEPSQNEPTGIDCLRAEHPDHAIGGGIAVGVEQDVGVGPGSTGGEE